MKVLSHVIQYCCSLLRRIATAAAHPRFRHLCKNLDLPFQSHITHKM